MSPSRVPGAKWFAWIANLTVRLGVLTGVYLSAVAVIALLAANRLPFLEPYAEIRNWVARGAFGLVMFIPVAVYFRAPARLIASASIGWGLFTLSYTLLGIPFDNLHTVLLRPFHAFMLGMSLYGVIAVAAWVASLAMEARSHPVASTRRRL